MSSRLGRGLVGVLVALAISSDAAAQRPLVQVHDQARYLVADERFVAFSPVGLFDAIRVIDTATGVARDVPHPRGCQPGSMEDALIIFGCGEPGPFRGVGLLHVGTGRWTELPAIALGPEFPARYYGAGASWSRLIAFRKTGGGPGRDVYVRRSDGRRIVRPLGEGPRYVRDLSPRRSPFRTLCSPVSRPTQRASDGRKWRPIAYDPPIASWQDGIDVWMHRCGRPRPVRIERCDQLCAQPAVSDGVIAFVRTDQRDEEGDRLVARRPPRPSVRWEIPVGGHVSSGPFVVGGSVWVLVHNLNYHGIVFRADPA